MSDRGSADPAVDIEPVIAHIRDARGFDFTGYKRTSLTRRFVKRFESLRLDSVEDYVQYLDAHPEEYADLFDTVLINVTSFFRDPETWAGVSEIVVPAISERERDEPIRVWVSGCASGEEAYTIAILLCEAMGEDALRHQVKIYATDVDLAALATGRLGRYPWKSLADAMDAERAERFFEQDGGWGTFRKDLRRAVIFGRHDLVADAPISKIDLLSCRNTLMYFTTEAQRSILEKFRFALRPEGFLVLGRSEALATRTNLFEPVDLKRRIFRGVGPAAPYRGLERARVTLDLGQSLAVDLRTTGFETSPVAQVVLDDHNTLVAANHAGRTLLGLGTRDLGRPLQDLEMSYRPLDLRTQIETVLAERHAVVVRGVPWSNGADHRLFDVTVAPLTSATGTIGGIGIAFVDVSALSRVQDELERSRIELEAAYEELQSTVEELETTNEELQSTNEELETTNEELQSTNEELETMNEELQSTNEELETTNDELRLRTDDLNDVNLFLEAVLAGLQSAVVVVDSEARIQVWNDHAQELWGLRADEVKGEHLMNLDIGLPLNELHASIRASLSGDGAQNRAHTVEAVNRRGRPILCTVSITPLQRSSDEVAGAILLMSADATSVPD